MKVDEEVAWVRCEKVSAVRVNVIMGGRLGSVVPPHVVPGGWRCLVGLPQSHRL